MAENRLQGETIGVIFDGAGYGADGTIWGGEFLVGGYGGFRRAGHLRQMAMPGGDAAAREPYRMAISLLYQLHGEELFDLPLPFLHDLPQAQQQLFLQILRKGVQSPLT
jgi:hydrogenase maturation protein HypF